MNPTGPLLITAHAVDRYRQRVNPAATEADVDRAVRASVPAASRVARWCAAMARARPGAAYRVAGEALFVLAPEADALVLLTVLPLSWPLLDMAARRLDKGKRSHREPRGKGYGRRHKAWRPGRG